jgi:hypothetical protein
MSRMIFDLTDDDRVALEAMRAHRGLRSHAEVLRQLIRQASGSGLPAPERQADIRAEVEHRAGSPMRLPRAEPGSRLKKR